jgi:hypothetical protein
MIQTAADLDRSGADRTQKGRRNRHPWTTNRLDIRTVAAMTRRRRSDQDGPAASAARHGSSDLYGAIEDCLA